MISPKDLIESKGLKGLCEAADAYYRHTTPVLTKPFCSIAEAPQILVRLGKVLEGLYLASDMKILDFGAGTCWLTLGLAQMGLRPIALDVSETALGIGRLIFQEHGTPEPPLLHFDGSHIPLEDGSVDRIICFDTLHHVPNRAEIFQEFSRILTPGGVAGFSEPVAGHSKTLGAQAEMSTYGVLEDDLELADLQKIAKENALTFIPGEPPGIFWLHKGSLVLDSRSANGLSCKIEGVTNGVRITNTGKAIWRHEAGLGQVNVGIHQYENGKMVAPGLYRLHLKRDILPGESFTAALYLPPGEYMVDMVAEMVCWFETYGSKPLEFRVEN